MLHQRASGYELRKEFDQSLKHFWHAELAQIYPALHQLEAEGQVSSRETQSEKGPKRRVYRRTKAGQRALTAWLSDGSITDRERFPYLAQVMFRGESTVAWCHRRLKTLQTQ